MKRLATIGLVVLALAATPAAALAAEPTTPECWGTNSADFARSYPGALGEHSSSFGTPRLGIGNVALLFTDTRQPGLLGGVLGVPCD